MRYCRQPHYLHFALALNIITYDPHTLLRVHTLGNFFLIHSSAAWHTTGSTMLMTDIALSIAGVQYTFVMYKQRA